jgi:hypothetical protein
LRSPRCDLTGPAVFTAFFGEITSGHDGEIISMQL